MPIFLRLRLCVVLSILFSLASGVAQAQSFTGYIDLHDFGGTVKNANGQNGPDGVSPAAGVTFDKAGNMYGTSRYGGPNGDGLVWEITASKTYVDLHDFGGTVTNANGTSGPDGTSPSCTVTVDANGNLFGTAVNGGPAPNPGGSGDGMVWEITNAGVYKDIHDFGYTVINSNGMSGNDGSGPSSGVTFDSAGNMYGTDQGGGANFAGMVWEITKSGTYKDFHDFGATDFDGGTPYGGVTFDTAGNMYGTTVYSGANEKGLVWEITKSGTFKDLHDFGGTTTNANGSIGPDGTGPSSSVTFDSLGNMYGTAPGGGANSNGILWEITNSATYKDLHDFGGTVTTSNGQSGTDGKQPAAAVTFDRYGNMFGAASIGGPNAENNGNNGAGMVWEFTTSGTYVDVFDIGSNGSTGFALAGGITVDGKDNLYSTTYLGGGNYSGSVFEVEAVQLETLTLSPSSVVGGNSATGTVTLNGPTPVGGVVIALSSANSSAVVPATVTVAAGASTANFAITTSPVPASTSSSINAKYGNVSINAVLNIKTPGVTGLTLSPTTVAGGLTSTGTVTIGGNAATGGYAIALTSNSAAATVPATVTIPAGATSATFSISSNPVATTANATITAAFGTSRTATLKVTAPVVTGISLNPTSVVCGTSSTGTVTLGSPAATGGTQVTLTSSKAPAVSVPASVTVAAGATSASFTVSTVVGSGTTSSISASAGGQSASATLTVTPLPIKVTLAPTTVTGGQTSTGTIILGSAAGAGGVTISLSSSSSVATVPASVSIASGATTATFTVSTTKVSANTSSTINASQAGNSASAVLTITAVNTLTLTDNPTSVVGGSPSVCTVTLGTAAPTGGAVIALNSSSTSATVPASITVAAGATTATFNIKTVPVSATATANVSGSYSGAVNTVSVTIKTPNITGLTLNPTSVAGGSSSTGTVTLGGAAPAGGFSITLKSNSSDATVPSTITIPAGATSATFTITTSSVTANVNATITATFGASTKSVTLTITG